MKRKSMESLLRMSLPCANSIAIVQNASVATVTLVIAVIAEFEFFFMLLLASDPSTDWSKASASQRTEQIFI